jgi:phosphopantothenoylcysteine decarboxylase/phosphopantothenate--cysteine ligase
MNTLRKMNMLLLTPVMVDGKAKISPTEEIVNSVINCLTLKDMKGLNVFVTAGPTYEYIDPIRVVTNRSTGKMGFALAREAWRRGANVTLVSGPTMLTPPDSIDYSSITTTHELINTVKSKMKEKKYDIFLAAAAPSDFRPVKINLKKMSSRISKPFDIQFESTEKAINIVKNIQNNIFLVAFKAEFNLNYSKIIERAKIVMHEVKADLVAANDVSQKDVGFAGDTNKILVLKKDGSTIDIPLNSKQIVAHHILDIIINTISKHPK